MYFHMTNFVLSKVTSLKAELKRTTGINIELASDTLLEDLVNAALISRSRKSYSHMHSILDDLRRLNMHKDHRAQISAYKSKLDQEREEYKQSA